MCDPLQNRYTVEHNSELLFTGGEIASFSNAKWSAPSTKTLIKVGSRTYAASDPVLGGCEFLRCSPHLQGPVLCASKRLLENRFE